MNVITNKISMDLLAAPIEQPAIHAVQGECYSRAVELTLLCGGSPWQIPKGTLLAVRYGRVLLTSGYYDTLPDGTCAYSYEGNVVTIMLAPQMMVSAGPVLVQVELTHGDQVLVTFSFRLMVAVNPACNMKTPEDYLNWQQWLEQELDKYIDKVSQSGQLLGGTMAGPLSMNGYALSGLGIPTANDHAANMDYVNRHVKLAAPRNLLDNSDFKNPVNQRGQASYTGRCYSIDRWIVDENTAVTVMNGFCRISGVQSLLQILPMPLKAGSMYTCAARIKASDGDRTGHIYVDAENGNRLAEWNAVINGWTTAIFSFTVTDDVVNASVHFHQSGDLTVSTDIAWAALYEGEYTENTLPDYQPKGYTAELLSCMYYYQTVQALAGTEVYTARRQFITLPIPMRITPTYTAELWSGEEADIQIQDNRTVDVTGAATYSHITVKLSADL